MTTFLKNHFFRRGSLKVLAAAMLAFGIGPVSAQSILSSLNSVPQVTLAGLTAAPVPADAAPQANFVCDLGPEPVVLLDTQSKYAQTGFKDTVDRSARQHREHLLAPVRAFLRETGTQAFSEDPVQQDCAANRMAIWASAGALTEMLSDDANLTRGRFMAEIGLIAGHLEANGRFSDRQGLAVKSWLSVVAYSTADYFRFRAGPKSRRNNHRYWAALAVGAAGYLGHDRDLVDWAHRSAEVGLSQVTDEGYLLLEIERGRQARNYHVYALRPLAALANLSASNGDDLYVISNGALARLARATLEAVKDPAALERLAGAVQAKPVKETDFVKPLRLSDGMPLETSLQLIVLNERETAKVLSADKDSRSEG